MTKKPLLIQGGKGAIASFTLPPGVTQTPGSTPRLPADVIPLHATPRPDGLAVDTSVEAYAHKRWSPSRWNPLRDRWPEIHELDERHARLEQRHGDTTAQHTGLRERLRVAEQDDRDALAVWVAEPSEPRPLPTAPGIEQRLGELEHEREALVTAMKHVLDEKAAFVVKHRPRLRAQAAKARHEAVEKLRETIEATMTARDLAVAAVEAERWAAEFPGQEADAASLRLPLVRGGRPIAAIPELPGGVAAAQMLEALRSDAAWLDSIAAEDERQKEETDPHFEAIWEQTDERRQAIGLANKRIREGLAPRHVQRAGWGD